MLKTILSKYRCNANLCSKSGHRLVELCFPPLTGGELLLQSVQLSLQLTSLLLQPQ